MPTDYFYLQQELSAYLQARHEKCKEAVAFLCGDDASSLPFLYIMWERDFYRDKLIECYEKNG